MLLSVIKDLTCQPSAGFFIGKTLSDDGKFFLFKLI